VEDEEDESEDEPTDEGLTTSDVEVLIAELAGQDLDEIEITETWAALEDKKRRTWKEGKATKREMKKSRKFYDMKDKAGMRTMKRRQMPIDELKKISKCANCGEKGHWHKECTKPHRPKQKSDVNGFTFAIFDYDILDLLRQVRAEREAGPVSFLTIEPGHAIVDTAAGQALIGQKYLRQLQEHLESRGLSTVEVPTAWSRRPGPPAWPGRGANEHRGCARFHRVHRFAGRCATLTSDPAP
jgi:hypothetical protein